MVMELTLSPPSLLNASITWTTTATPARSLWPWLWLIHHLKKEIQCSYHPLCLTAVVGDLADPVVQKVLNSEPFF